MKIFTFILAVMTVMALKDFVIQFKQYRQSKKGKDLALTVMIPVIYAVVVGLAIVYGY
ncbi:MAG: hypothetical protein SCK70_06245 [bacterium]|nr:hypothetical protein [bacterium]